MMYGLTRATMTLVGAAGAGFLLWLASQLDTDSNSEYWAIMGLLAAAGLAIAFSQLLGGWTKWGVPRISGAVFLFGFLPALVAGGLVLLHAQPDSGAWGTDWASDLGAGDLADDLATLLPAIAFGLGLLFGLTFDTAGPGVREVTREEVAARRRDDYAGPAPVGARTEDEPLTADRDVVQRRTYEATDRDDDGVPDRDETDVKPSRQHEDRAYDEVHERGTPVAPQPDPDATQPPAEPPRRGLR